MEDLPFIKSLEKLISKGNLGEAIVKLKSHFNGRNDDLYLYFSQLEAQHFQLSKDKLGNIISFEEASREESKLRQAVLMVINSLKTGIPPQLPNALDIDPNNLEKTIKWSWWLIGSILLISVGYLSYRMVQDRPTSFPLTIYIYGPKGASDVLDYGQVWIRIGQYRLGPKEVNELGQVHFEEIPINYAKDSIKLEFLGRPYELISQSAYFPHESEKITFQVKPASTMIRGTVYDQGERISGAILDFDSGLVFDTTDAQGNFKVLLPYGEGDKIELSILYEGKERFRRFIQVLSAESKKIQLYE